jgi:predicted PurR-regulated permease PerM
MMTAERSSNVARNALVIIAVILGGGALRFLGGVLTPLLLAVFLAVMVDGLAELIRSRAPGLPTVVPTLIAVFTLAGAFGLCVIVIAARAGGFVETLSAAEPRLVGIITQMASALRIKQPSAAANMALSLDPTVYLGGIALALQGFVSNAIYVLIYVGFMIASKHAFDRKAVKLFRHRGPRHEAMSLARRVRDSIQSYLWIQTVTGALIAVVSWAIMAAVGLQNAVFWAFLIFIVNYVPIVGAIAAIVAPALFAVVQFDTYWQAIVILAGLWLITFLVGNILLPRLQGDRLNMDPLVVLLSLAFWGALWGLPGMFLSTPLTVLVMLILAQFEGSRWLAVMLSADGEPDRLGKA